MRPPFTTQYFTRKKERNPMTSLLLLRHGQIKANREGRWHGSTDSPMTRHGRRQARRTARHLATNHKRLSAIYTSPLQRCTDTASVVADRFKMTPVVIEGLSEYAIGEWEDMPFQHLSEELDFINRATSDLSFAPPGGESLKAVAGRIVAAMRDIGGRHEQDDEQEQILIVSHGAVMAVALGALLHTDPGRWTDYHFANCSLTELVLSESPYVNFFNSTQHL